MMDISEISYRAVVDIIRDSCGIVLGDNKQYLVTGRLPPVARALGLGSLDELITRARSRPEVLDSVIDAMTTNETSFFRDNHPFESMRTDLFPALIEKRADSRRLQIWSAACSTGQEALSLAILLHDHFPRLAGWHVNILGTDISDSALAIARAGVYGKLEVSRGLSPEQRDRHFDKTADGWMVRPHLSRRLTFTKMNLLTPWAMIPNCDLILLRNVLIYFDDATKADLLYRAQKRLMPDGYLLLGSTELPAGGSVGVAQTRMGRTTVYQ